MEIAAVVVSVAYESVSAGPAAAVKDRTQTVQFTLEYRNPAGIRVVFLVYFVYTAVAEIGVQCVGGIVGRGSAGVGTVHHVNGYAAVVQQFRHFVDLGCRAAAVQR